MAKTQTRWKAGRYVLLSDRFRQRGTQHDALRGDVIELDSADAARLGPVGCIAHPDSREAVQARNDPDEQKRQRIAELEAEAQRLRDEKPLSGRAEEPPEGVH